MRIWYPGPQNAVIDQEDNNHNIVPGKWRNGVQMHDVPAIDHGNHATVAGKHQRQYLKLYYNSPAGAVPWQQNMI